MRLEDLNAEQRSAFDMWHNFFGLSEESALAALRADGLVEESARERSESVFCDGFGLSVEGARVAAAGRGGRSRSVSEGVSDSFETRLRKAEEALAEMSDREIDTMLAEETRRRRVPKKSAPAKSSEPGKKHPAVVSEHGKRR
jgi:hypothetical protein